MNGEDLDKAIHDCINIIWKAYRESVTTKNFKPFNECFHGLYEKYNDASVHKFIGWYGLALVPAATRRIRQDGCEA